ncbi:Shikimate dehydrogenase (NADP(+)) [Paenibacillus polymyxa E681]|uniref:shikimate dehydrogenase n=1 Tax=Paenibacillus polymyxa TaxID=1406 RepID=UPI0001E31F94|nr:shikimate dehydrogenase [Paenibacillus polymyxa]ADM71060.1 shikimate 5-dehydrogenase [Paenibacillus polymyxa E681]QNV58085.1 Shikimate dehydrogenase (NADP(+)) [Paenibacillus polymyxa E681]QNV62922.1 Shikimate dehydrogenase (NADP(+)) [Paenibacillus polymyxa E681]
MNSGESEATEQGLVLLGVLGDPIKHSKSPLMHKIALQAAGIEGDFVPLHVKPDQLEDAMKGIRAMHFRGVNVTIPHKVEVMKYLDEIDEGARLIGAVNTIVNDNGRLKGYNTDGIGYVRSLKEETSVDLKGARIAVLGAGGAARGVIHALLEEQPESVIILNRTRDKAEQLALEWTTEAIPVRGYSNEDAKSVLATVNVLINTTSVGMSPLSGELPLEASLIPEGIIVSDLIYNPLETRLLRESREQRGCTVHGGLGMFVYQGAVAFEYFTGVVPAVEQMRAAVLSSLS